MNEVKPDAGTAPVFYCKPVNDKGGPCHAPDCDHRSSCMLQMKRQQHSKDGKTVTHQDPLTCTITCGYCGKRRQNGDRMGIKVVKEVARGVAKVDPLTPRGAPQRPLHLPLLPKMTPRSAHRGITLPLRGITPRRGDWPGWPSPSWLQRWMSSSLLRSRGGGSEEEDLVFWILVKIGDQVFRAVLDTGATLSIVARRLLKTFKKTKTVAIRVGDWRTIHSLGGGSM